MKKTIRSTSLILFATFSALFVFRLAYGFYSHPAGGSTTEQIAGQGGTTFDFTRKNYASIKGEVEKSGGSPSVPLGVDQKYEKVGTITTKSKDYEADENRARQTIVGLGGLIQFEQSSGLPGKRSLHLAIGVVPEKFDQLIGQLKAIGSPLSIRTDKTDKTNEYKSLNAKRASLENSKKSLETLKSLGTGSIEEMIELETKISTIEAQIQDLGVSLGDYDEENEFCTVKCSLLEVSMGRTGQIGVLQRVKTALEWTVKIYLRLVVIGIFGTLALWSLFLFVTQLDRRFPAFFPSIMAVVCPVPNT